MTENILDVAYLPAPIPPSPTPPDSYDTHRSALTPLVIDNGATQLRWGFATAAAPRCAPNAVAKYKERKHNTQLLLFGAGTDAEGGAKGQAKTPWEGDVLLNCDALENALDYAFIQLGIDTPSVDHPILMTERLCSPLHSRAHAVMSFYHNNIPAPPTPFTSDGLVVSFNTASTSVIPILHGKGIISHSQRIPWGASHSADYLLKLIQLKYPNFPTRITSQQSTWMLHSFCSFASDYPTLLRRLKDPLRLRAAEQVIQFPYALPVVEEKNEEELARAAEKRKEQGKRLHEMAAKSRMEKLLKKESDLQYLTNLREGRGEDGDWEDTLNSEGFADDAALDAAIKKLEGDLKRVRKKETDADEPVEEPSFPLVDVPDADLDEDGQREKRKQKLMKAGFDARMRAKREKDREREEREAEERRDGEEREKDLAGWAGRMRKEQETLMNRIKERARRKAALSDRKSAAAQARMKSIASLAADDRVPKKKRKTGGEDMFGADDADWAIYRKINTAAASSDEEDDLNQLQEVERKLLLHDPTFEAEHTYASIMSQKSALVAAFKPLYEEGDVAGNAKIHLSTERWRVCEAWFSPGMAGVDSAGLGEVIQNILARFSDNDKARLAKNVFVSGAPAQLPGLIPRLHAALRPLLPPETPLAIVRAADPARDAWRGMAGFARTEGFARVGVTRAEYEEWGAERVKRWWGGNWNGSVAQ